MIPTVYDSKNKTWKGPKTNPIYNPNQNLGNLMLQCLHQRSSEIAQISADSDIALTCRQYRERAIAMAEYFKKYDLKDGDFIGFVGYNTENLMPTVVACYTLGIPICPLSPIMTENDIVSIYGIVKPPIILCDKRNLSTVQEAVTMMKYPCKIMTIMEKIPGYECATEIMKNFDLSLVNDFVAPNFDPDKILAIICSSGSTGTPKRIIKTHREMIIFFHHGWKLKRIHPAVYFNYSALFWISGFNSSIFAILNHSTCVIHSELQLPATEIVDLLHKYRVTHVVMLPFTICNILEVKNLKPFDYIESLMVSGFAATESLCKKIQAYLPRGEIWISYGLTEKYIVSCNMTEDYNHIGYLNDNYEVKIIDADGNKVGPGVHGEICIKDDPPFSGYHADPKKTLEAVKDGWFHSSDIGYFDEENRLRYVDRKVEIMNYEGYYIIPHEMESLINEIEGVVNSAIIGVLEKESINYIIHAFVMLDKSKNLTEKDITDYVHSKVIEQRQIRGGVHFVDDFPLGRTGKVDKVKLRELATKRSEIKIIE